MLRKRQFFLLFCLTASSCSITYHIYSRQENLPGVDVRSIKTAANIIDMFTFLNLSADCAAITKKSHEEMVKYIKSVCLHKIWRYYDNENI